MSRAIDAEALEKDGWMMHRTVQVDKNIMSYETKKPTDFPTIEPERKKGLPLIEKREWIKGYENRWYRKKFYCASCGIKIKTESWDEKRCFGEGTILQDNDMPNFCPNCGADLREGAKQNGYR